MKMRTVLQSNTTVFLLVVTGPAGDSNLRPLSPRSWDKVVDRDVMADWHWKWLSRVVTWRRGVRRQFYRDPHCKIKSCSGYSEGDPLVWWLIWLTKIQAVRNQAAPQVSLFPFSVYIPLWSETQSCPTLSLSGPGHVLCQEPDLATFFAESLSRVYRARLSHLLHWVLEVCGSESDSDAVGSANPCCACGGDSVALVLSPPVVYILEENVACTQRWYFRIIPIKKYRSGKSR